MTEKTAVLKDIRMHPNRFYLGGIVEIIDIGRYTIVVSDGTERRYSCYVDGDYTGRSPDNIDEAMVTCVAFGRWEGASFANLMASAALKTLTP